MDTPHISADTEAPSRTGWMKRVLRASMRSFRARLVVALGILGSLVGILTFSLGPTLTPQLRTAGLAISIVAFTTIVLFHTVRALVALAREGEWLAKDADTAWSQVRSLNQEKKEWQEQPDTPSRLTRLASALCGVVYYNHVTDGTLKHDGAFELVSRLAMAATVSGVDSIEHHVYAPHAPEQWDQAIELTAQDKDDKSVRLMPVIVEKSAQRLEWLLKAIPEFKRNDRIEYRYKEDVPPGSFAMTRKELFERNMQWESMDVFAEWPTERMSLSVKMPAGFVPADHDFDVWFGVHNKLRHQQEYARLRALDFWRINRNPQTNEIVYTLDVTFPIQGLHYAIKWIPP